MDLEEDLDVLPGRTSVRGDICESELVDSLFSHHRFAAVYHAAAQLAHVTQLDEHLLLTSNVDGTRVVARDARRAGVKPFVFISTNCRRAADVGHAIQEDVDVPAPIELYGKSKLAAEQVLLEFKSELNVVTLRCPTIMDAGRLGLLVILYEFMDHHRTVWVVGGGENRYQFIYADDLASACLLASEYGRSELFHIGSDNVKSMRGVYEEVVRRAGSRSKVRALPKAPTLWLMRLFHKLRLSPLGPYHYKMIAESFLFDTSRIKARLGWQPTLTNEEMLLLAYRYNSENREEIAQRANVSAHRKALGMGIIRVLKWLS